MDEDDEHTSTWTCPLCKSVFVGKHAKAVHYKNFFKAESDPTRCDYLLACQELLCTPPPASSPSASSSPSPSVPSPSAASSSSSDTSPPLITTPAEISAISVLCRRTPALKANKRRLRCSNYIMKDATVPSDMLPRDMTHVMRMWNAYIHDVNECCSEQFWHFYLALHTQPGMLPRDMINA